MNLFKTFLVYIKFAQIILYSRKEIHKILIILIVIVKFIVIVLTRQK